MGEWQLLPLDETDANFEVPTLSSYIKSMKGQVTLDIISFLNMTSVDMLLLDGQFMNRLIQFQIVDVDAASLFSLSEIKNETNRDKNDSDIIDLEDIRSEVGGDEEEEED